MRRAFAVAGVLWVGAVASAVAVASLGQTGGSRPSAAGGGNGGTIDLGSGMVMSSDGRMAMPAPHLQAMIDATPTGGTLTVPAADYLGTIRVDRPITIDGAGAATLEGGGEGSVIRVTAPGVTIRGLTVAGSGPGPTGSPSAILLEGADGGLVQDVRIERSYLGITVRRSKDVVIERVRIEGRGLVAGELHAVDSGSGGDPGMAGHEMGPPTDAGLVRGDGIWLWNTADVVVRDSTISRVRDGIYLSYGVRARLERNTIVGGRYAVHDMYAEDLTVADNALSGNLSGVVVMYGGPVDVHGNTIVESGSPSTGFGVLIKDAGSVTLRENVIADNRVGLHLDDAGRTGGAPTRVIENTLALNQIGVVLYPSADGVFSGNGFVENSTQVSVGGDGSTQVRWSVGGVGNHWSDYVGFDAGGDGVGDVPYTASGRLSELLAREPMLEALASGPAFRLLATVADRWASNGEPPAVQDPAPLVVSRGPGLGDARSAGGGWAALAGAAILAASASALSVARRPRKVARRG